MNEAGDVLPASLDEVMRLTHKLIDVVIVAVVEAVVSPSLSFLRAHSGSGSSRPKKATMPPGFFVL